MKKTISKVINIVLVVILAYLLLQKFALNRPEKQINIEQLEIVDLNGQSINWDELEGKAVFLNFWASWCGPCMAEMPSIQASINHFEDEEIVYVIANTQSLDDAINVKNKEKYAAMGDDFYYMDRRKNSLVVPSIPTTYLIDHTGKVKKVHVGLNHWNSPLAKKKIKALLP